MASKIASQMYIFANEIYFAYLLGKLEAWDCQPPGVKAPCAKKIDRESRTHDKSLHALRWKISFICLRLLQWWFARETERQEIPCKWEKLASCVQHDLLYAVFLASSPLFHAWTSRRRRPRSEVRMELEKIRAKKRSRGFENDQRTSPAGYRRVGSGVYVSVWN